MMYMFTNIMKERKRNQKGAPPRFEEAKKQSVTLVQMCSFFFSF